MEPHRISKDKTMLSATRYRGTCSVCGLVILIKRRTKYTCSTQERAATIRRKYGVTEDEVPGTPGVCAIRETTENICIDHDHETGEVRGWLCKPCNSMLGMAKDDPELLGRAIDYLHGE